MPDMIPIRVQHYRVARAPEAIDRRQVSAVAGRRKLRELRVHRLTPTPARTERTVAARPRPACCQPASKLRVIAMLSTSMCPPPDRSNAGVVVRPGSSGQTALLRYGLRSRACPVELQTGRHILRDESYAAELDSPASVIWASF